MTKVKTNDVCILYYGLNEKGVLEIEDGMNLLSVARNITVEQALNIAKVFTSKYKEVKLYDGKYEAYLSLSNRIDKPILNTYYPEDYNAVGLKYGLIVKVEDVNQTDLEQEKWDNYWGDYNQCGVRVDY